LHRGQQWCTGATGSGNVINRYYGYYLFYNSGIYDELCRQEADAA